MDIALRDKDETVVLKRCFGIDRKADILDKPIIHAYIRTGMNRIGSMKNITAVIEKDADVCPDGKE